MKGIVKIGNWGRARADNLLNKFPLAKYQSPDFYKQQLLAVFKGQNFQNEFLLNHAVEIRKKEIQWLWLCLPSLVFGFSMLYYILAGLSSLISWHTYLSISMVLMLAVVFRITFYSEYLDSCKRLMQSAADILKNIPARAAIGMMQKTGEIQAALLHEKQSILREEGTALQGLPTSKLERRPVSRLDPQADEPAERMVYGEEMLSLFREAGEACKKGKINLFLLDQLLRHECGEPCIYDGNIYANIKHSAFISGCKPKNILTKSRNYRSRQSINPKTSNNRTNQLRYLEILLGYYRHTGNLTLYKRAIDLHSFITSLKISGKMR